MYIYTRLRLVAFDIDCVVCRTMSQLFTSVSVTCVSASYAVTVNV